MESCRLFLCGAPRLEHGGRVVPLATRKVLALLAYLAVTARPHRRDSLAELLWPGSPPERARAALRRTLFALRQALRGKGLVLDRETVALDTATVRVDARDFERLAASTDSADLEEAAGLSAESFLAGFSLRDTPEFDDWQSRETERLRSRAMAVLERLALQRRERGAWEEATAFARRWLALDTLNEAAHRLVIELLAAAGQRGAAQAQFEECRRLLARELGVAPMPRTAALAAAAQAGELEAAAAPAAPPPSERPIGAESERLLGRAPELARLLHLLIDEPACRLISLLGPGGVGKTVLAAEVAARASRAFADGSRVVPLADLEQVDLVPQALAEALAIPLRGSATPRAQLLTAAATRRCLLVLDNFEHLMPAAELLVDLLAAAPGIRLLVTSRERLHLEAEWCFEIEGLAYPEARDTGDPLAYPAVRLFLAHARRARPDVTELPGWPEQALAICRLCQGLPLALELAAAWVRALPLAEIRALLGQGLDLLSSSRRDLPDRHRSMRAVFARSWQRLSEEERRVFRELTIFAGGFSRRAAERVATARLTTLASLIDHCVLKTAPGGRYHIHQLLRQFGAEQLAAEPAALRAASERHALYFAGELAARFDAIRGPAQLEALREIGEDIENVRLAWQTLVQLRLEAGIVQAVETLFHFYEIGCRFHEGERVFDAARRSLGAERAGGAGAGTLSPAARLAALASGAFKVRLGKYQQAKQDLEQARGELDESAADRTQGLALVGLTLAETMLGDYAAGARRARLATTILERTGEPWSRALVLHLQGELAYGARRYGEAEALLEASSTLFRRVGDRRMVARVLIGRARLASALGQAEQARHTFEEGLDLCRQLGDRWGMALCLTRLGAVSLRSQASADAAGYFAESLELCRTLGDRRGVVLSLTGLGQAAWERGERAPAREHLGQALELAVELGSHPLLLGSVVAALPLLVEEGRGELAAEALELAAAHPALTRETRDAVDRLRAARTPGAASKPSGLTIEQVARALRDTTARPESPPRPARPASETPRPS